MLHFKDACRIPAPQPAFLADNELPVGDGRDARMYPIEVNIGGGSVIKLSVGNRKAIASVARTRIKEAVTQADTAYPLVFPEKFAGFVAVQQRDVPVVDA